MARNNLVFESLFNEDASITQWPEQSHVNAWNVNLDSNIKRAGNSSARFELRKDAAETSGPRAELGRNRHVAQQEAWYGFSVYLPTDFQDDVSGEAISQWYAYPDFDLGESWRSPSMALLIINGRFRLDMRSDSNPVTLPGDETFEKIDITATTKGVWHDWVFRAKWTHEDVGVLEGWHNGNKFIERLGEANNYNDAYPPFFKCGIYKWDWANSSSASTTTLRALYIDEVRIGNGKAKYKDVAPGQEKKYIYGYKVV